MSNNRKVVKFEEKRFPNIMKYLVALILLYVIVIGWNYITQEHIAIYEVNTSSISDDTPMYGFIIRNEEIVYSEETGYINYYNAEGNRVGIGDVVYTVDSNGEVSSMLEQIQSSKDTVYNISSMREIIATYQNSFDMSTYYQVDNFLYDIKNELFEQSRGSLYSDLDQMFEKSGKDKSFTNVSAVKSGVLAYSIDGYENYRKENITAELFSKYDSVSPQRIQNLETTEAGSPVYRLVSNNDWSLIVKLDDVYFKELQEMDYVRVTIKKDDISFNAAVELFDNNGTHFAKLTTSRYMERYINDRFLEIEFNLKSATGLKIPNSSIFKKNFFVISDDLVTTGNEGIGVVREKVDEEGQITHEFVAFGDSLHIDGEYYVSDSVLSSGDILMNASGGNSFVVQDKKSLSGVYYVNEGYCKFRPIDILYQNKEYTIISDSTRNGLSTFDHIVVEPAALDDDDFIN